MTGIGFKRGKKAAPRFELGIKDLQSSALPLGHAASREFESPPADRISEGTHSLLILCNGHGEDQIAVRVLEALHKQNPSISLNVLPLVGEGKAFENAISEGWLRRIGPSACLPSGGFSNQSFFDFLSDIAFGLIQITWSQWQCLREAVNGGQQVLAVGDLLPLFFAWSSGANYGFIGTPKSDYTWRSGPGRAISDYYHRFKGTEWDPWEWILMRSFRCKIVAVRDELTARALRRNGVEAMAPGNPMMDGLQITNFPSFLNNKRRLILLCGSRSPEAVQNFERLLDAIEELYIDEPIAILVALSEQPKFEELKVFLESAGYRSSHKDRQQIDCDYFYSKGLKQFIFGTGRFAKWVSWAEVGLTTAGTATEQLVGLGTPALSLPGNGPQFGYGFAKRQSRLLGGAVISCRSPLLMAERLQFLLKEKPLRRRMGQIGIHRMGPSGGSEALASLLLECLL